MSRLGDALGCVLLGLVLVAVGCAGRCIYYQHQGNPPAAEQAGAPAATVAPPAATGRDPSWAVPMERPGLPNLNRVTADPYRGAQPLPEGYAELKKMGVKTIVNLRSAHSEKEEAEAAGLGCVSIPMHAWHAEDEDVVRLLQAATDPKLMPIFVHCQHGSDRTGVCMAAYRIVVQGWSKTDAIREMTEGSYGFHGIWENLIDYLQKMDVAAIRKKAGLPAAGEDGPKP